MCPKSMIISRDWWRLKLEHRFMPVPKYGEINPMEVNRIFGLSAAFFMKCVVLSLLSTAKISMTSTRACREATMTLCQKFILENYSKLYPCVSGKGRKTGQLLRNFSVQTALFFPNATITKYLSKRKAVSVKTSCYQQSKCQQTWRNWIANFLSPSTTIVRITNKEKQQ